MPKKPVIAERLARLEASKYGVAKKKLGEYSPEKFEAQIEVLKSTNAVKLSDVETAAHKIGVLHSVLYYEYFKRMTDGLRDMEKTKDRLIRAKEFGMDELSLKKYRNKLLADRDFIPLNIHIALKRDEVSEHIFGKLQNLDTYIDPVKLKNETIKKFNLSGRTVYTGIVNKLKADPHLGPLVTEKWSKYIGKPLSLITISKAHEKKKKKLFEILDDVHAAGLLFKPDGTVNSRGEITKPRHNRFNLSLYQEIGRVYNWRIFDNAVKEWKKDRKI